MVERLDIVVTEKGARTVRRNIEGIGTGATTAQRGVLALTNAIKFIGAGAAITALVRLADSYTNVQNRLKLVTNGTQNLKDVTKGLTQVAQETRSSFEGTAELYARTALATKELGIGQQELLGFTKSVNQAIILSGASATEASAGLIQLSQGLASGALRGDELRSVLEQLPAVADVIAESLNVTRGELRQMGTEGKITSQVIFKAFQEGAAGLQAAFDQTQATVGQAFTNINTAFVTTLGALDQATGASKFLADTLLLVADNMDLVIIAAIGAGAALGTFFAVKGVLAAVTAVRALSIAIAANPLLTAVSVAAILAVGVAVKSFGTDILTLTREMLGLNRAERELDDVTNTLTKGMGNLGATTDDTTDSLNKQKGAASGLAGELNVAATAADRFASAQKGVQAAAGAADSAAAGIAGAGAAAAGPGQVITQGFSELFAIQQEAIQKLGTSLTGVKNAFEARKRLDALLNAPSARELIARDSRESITGSNFGNSFFDQARGTVDRGTTIPKFNDGGSIMVGGRGGIDNNLLSINGRPQARVSKGEQINVVPRGQSTGNVTMVVNTPDANSFRRSAGQIQSQMQRAQNRQAARNS